MAYPAEEYDREKKPQALFDRLRRDIMDILVRMGYPKEFGYVIAGQLRTEISLRRMIGYLLQAKPRSAEEIADELLAIQADREAWVQKKSAEYYNSRYNELLNDGLAPDGESETGSSGNSSFW